MARVKHNSRYARRVQRLRNRRTRQQGFTLKQILRPEQVAMLDALKSRLEAAA